jgi:hypothetical protein
MNFTWGEKKWREPLARVPATMPGPCWGRAPGKIELMYHKAGCGQAKDCRFSLSRTLRIPGHLAAATALTSIVSPFKVPVTAAFLPACLSNVAKAVLSVVSRM